MASSCVECSKKWEDEMYWSHFHTLQFCQFLSGRFHHHLEIPQKFSNSLREKLGGTVTLRGPSGHVWNVGLVKNGNVLLLKDGWKTFVEDHSLKENDILMFRYNGNSIFDVTMFDRDSLCEKATSYFVKKCDHTESGRGCNKRIRSLGGLEDTDEPLEDVDNGPIAKNPRNDAATPPPPPPSRERPARSATKGRRGKKGKRGSSGAYHLQLKSRRREVSDEEKLRAQQMAVAASKDDSFIVVMRPSHVYKGFYMSIPAGWARVNLLNKNQEVELRVGETTWRANYLFKGYSGGLVGGWKNFVVENFLEEFDVCLFDRASGAQDPFILDVKIFRVVEEVIPPTRVT